jgi:Regulator of chromosome condensation (RCC1) repeat
MITTSGRFISAVALLFIVACDDSTSPPATGHFEIVQGPPERAAPGLYLLDTMRVRLVDHDGHSLDGRAVTWVVRQGGGSVVPVRAQTDADGIAEARWALGSVAGVNEIEVSTTEDSSVTFLTTAEAFRVDQLDSDYGLACGLVQGDAWCWGQDSWVESEPVSEQPSDVFVQNYNAPGLALAGQQLVAVAVGWPGGCGINGAGTVQCFGSGNPAFAALPTVPSMRQLTASGAAFCGLAASDSTAWCWDFMTGAGSPVAGSPAFLELSVAIGSSGLAVYGCGRRVDSTAVCWGDGPRGNGSLTPSDTIADVSGGMLFAEISVGWDFACGRLANGELWCWGQNGNGQLGSAGPPSPVPVLVTTGVSRLATSGRTGMAIRNGSVVRWGADQLGAPLGPLPSLAGAPVENFAAHDVSCVHLVDQQVYCFDELWFTSTSFDVDRYSPVQPVVE